MDTNTTTGPTEADLRALAVAADAGESLDNTQTDSPERADSAPETADQGTQTQTTQTGAAPASTEQQAQQQHKQPEQKRESEYQKFLREKDQLAKEKQRLAQTWQQVQAEKERLRQPAPQQAQKPAPAGNTALQKYSTEDLHDIATQYEDEGNTRLAKVVRQEIAHRQTAQQSQAQQQPPAQPTAPNGMPVEQFEAEWKGHLTALTAADPQLTDPQSPIHQEMREVIKFPYFTDHPAKVKEAYEFAKMRLEARAAPELRSRLTTLEKELNTLRKATAPGTGSAESRGANKRFEDMNDAEQVAWLKRQAAEVDAA